MRYEMELEDARKDVVARHVAENKMLAAHYEEIFKAPPRPKPSTNLQSMYRVESLLIKQKDFDGARNLRMQIKVEVDKDRDKQLQELRKRHNKDLKILADRQDREIDMLQDRIDTKRNKILSTRDMELEQLMHKHHKSTAHLCIIQGEEIQRNHAKIMFEARLRGVDQGIKKLLRSKMNRRQMGQKKLQELQLPGHSNFQVQRGTYSVPRAAQTERGSGSRMSRNSYSSRKPINSGAQTDRSFVERRPPPIVWKVSHRQRNEGALDLPAVCRQWNLPNIARRDHKIIVSTQYSSVAGEYRPRPRSQKAGPARVHAALPDIAEDPDNADCPMYGTSPKPPKNKNTPTNPKSPKPPPRIADVEQILEESRPQHHSRPKPKAPKIPKPKLSAKEQWLENKRAELERSPLHVPNAKVIPKVPGQAPRMGATRAAEKLRGETQRGQQRHAEKGKQAKRSEGIGQVEHKEIGQVEDAPEAEPPMPK